MATISYFQKYSQQENHITNNTLLMFRHIYRHSPLRFEEFLREVVSDDKIDIGLMFSQQDREESSIPDGYIRQKPLGIYIEAKVGGEIYEEQIQRHVDSAVSAGLPRDSAIIMGLSKEPSKGAEIRKFKSICEAEGIHYISTTYSYLVELLKNKNIFPEHETDLQEIIEDYEEFLWNEKVLLNRYGMVIFSCGISWDENIKYGIYYHEAERPSKAHFPFMGIYKDKKITHIGKILGTYVCEKPENGEMKFEKEHGDVSEDDIDKIKKLMVETKYYDLNQGKRRYYILDKLYKVDIKKESFGGIRRVGRSDLQEISGGELLEGDSPKQIAEKVFGKSFK